MKALSLSALRMRKCRERRRQGDVMVTLKVGPNITDGLTELGWLPSAGRLDKGTVALALAGLIDQAITMRVTLSTAIKGGGPGSPLRITPEAIATGLDESSGLLPMPRAPVDAVGYSETQPWAEKPQLSEIDGSSLWNQRITLWRHRKMWMPEWGPRPDQDGCLAPDYLL